MIARCVLLLTGAVAAAQAEQPAVSGADSELQRGLAAYAAGRPAEAIAPLRRVLKAQPGHSRAQDVLAASLAETGYCREAMPGILRAAARATDRNFRRALQIGGLRCAMSLNAARDALSFLSMLSRDFPDDPEVLYLTTHAYSDLSIKASQDLIAKAPESYQVRLLNAEALEVQGKWDEALAEYRAVLDKGEEVRGVHYRIAQLLLSKQNAGPAEEQQARAELEAELGINPGNPGAEYVLGELDRRGGKWDQAIAHFSRAAKLDSGFAGAHLGLARALMEAGRLAEAATPLEAAAKLQPENPEVYFRLGTVYRNTGRADEAARAFALYKQTSELARKSKESIQKRLDGLVPAR